MSTVSFTLVPQQKIFPRLLPNVPQPHPTPLPKWSARPTRMNTRRDLERELADLSAEEEEIEKISSDIKDRGYTFLVPIGRMYTQEQERAEDEDGDDDDDDDDDGTRGGPSPPLDEDGEDESQDLDADMEDMDDDVGNVTAETADTEDTEDVADSEEEAVTDP